MIATLVNPLPQLLAQAASPVPKAMIGTDGFLFIVAYLTLLILIGWLGHRAKKEDSLTDFYLGGRGLGMLVLLLTLYATQYSGNTMMGFVGSAYRQGFQFLVSVTFMMAIVGFYLIYAPRLQRLSQDRHLVTMGDFLQHRYRSSAVTVAATVLGVVALGNYVLTNLKALGSLTERVVGIEGSYAPGVIILALVMLAYELLGGLRSVAWTDVVQGIILFIGVVTIFIVVQIHYGSLTDASAELQAQHPELLQVPGLGAKVDWLCTIVLVGVGIAMYPHAIQRIYAAKNARTLKRSLQVMVFMPLFTTLLMVVLGLVGITQFVGLDKPQSDQVTLLWLGQIVQDLPAMKWLVVVCLCAIVAATMSTVDSALLAIASLMTKDIYPRIRPNLDQKTLSWLGKLTSLVVMVVTVGFAILLKDSQTIWALIKLKLELLCQVAPAFMIGIHWKRLRSGPVLLGMVLGTMIAGGLRFLEWSWLAIVPAGIVGLATNILVAVLGSLRPKC